MLYVPVVDFDQKPLMPTTANRAASWIKSGKATPFWKKGVFCVRLNQEPSARNLQPIVVGIDPGSKKEGFTVKSTSHTYLNIQADAIYWVKKAIEVRKMMRRARRQRKTPFRKPRSNKCRSKGRLPPSTKARWQWKLRLCRWLCKMFPINQFIVEDVAAKAKKNCRKWNKSFSPLEVGKNWFYRELAKIALINIKKGYETKALRDAVGLKKSKNKMSNKFNAHCVDSWVLANSIVGGHIVPDNIKILLVIPLRFHRRQLHSLCPKIGGIRNLYGGTISMGLKRGSLIKYSKYGVCYVGGTSRNKITICSVSTGERLSRSIIPTDCKFLTYSSWRTTTN